MPDIPFPVSSMPGRRPGEGGGRLSNVYAEKDGPMTYWRRVPGLLAFGDATVAGCRGLLNVAGTVVKVVASSVYKIDPAGTATFLGTLPGSDGVTLARNNKTTDGASTPDIVAARESGGAFVISLSGGVTAYPDADLPTTVNSVDFLGGYFLFSLPDGRFFASDLNSTAINALSFATAEASADGLMRGVVANGRYYAMGTETIEIWANQGLSPFPLGRAATVIPVGLLTTMAVAGFEEGWDRQPFFVAHDGTARMIDGYTALVVSSPDVEAFIARSTISTLEAYVYTFRGRAKWVLSSDAGTWEYDVGDRVWNERISVGLSRWRASKSVKANGRWLLGDTLGATLLAVSETTRTEAGATLVATAESGPLKAFPARQVDPDAFFEFTAATGDVALSWSGDGGVTWSNPLTRSMAQGEHVPSINRFGLAGARGMRFRWSISADVDFSFLGASVPEPDGRAP